MKLLWLSILSLSFCTLAYAQEVEQSERVGMYNLSDNGVALQGYDPVSYFSNDKPIEGDPNIQYTYVGVTYYFASEENQAVFKANPGKYEPAYGGWCAYAMGEDGSKVKVDPETYKIIDGELYLFYHTFWSNTLPKWNEEEKKLKPKADKNWNSLLTKSK